MVDKSMKKVGIVFFSLILLVISISFTSGSMSPLYIKGRVIDRVTGDVVDSNNLKVTINCGSSNLANVGTGELQNGEFDSSDCGEGTDGITLTIKAERKDDPRCYESKTFTTDGGGELRADMSICCRPSGASGFNPKSLVIANPIDVEFSWSAGSINPNYAGYDFWETFKGPEEVVDASSPIVISNLKSLSGWSVESCNGVRGGDYCCVQPGTDAGSSNNPCPAPTNLKGVYDKDAGVIKTTWESSDTDSDGHACHDVWKAKSLAEGDPMNNPSYSDERDPANSGEEAVAKLVTIWEVRSCDIANACSGWVQAITPSCNEVSRDCPSIKSCYDSGGSAIPLSSGIFGDEPIANINVGDREIPLRISYLFLIFGLLFMSILSFILYKEYRSQRVSEFGI